MSKKNWLADNAFPIAHFFVALGIMICYVLLLKSMYDRYVFADHEAANWDHAQTLLSGLNAIVFTAAGVLLGSSVQQARTAEAKTEAAKAKTEAVTANTEAEKASATTNEVRAEVEKSIPPVGGGPPTANETLLRIGRLVGARV